MQWPRRRTAVGLVIVVLKSTLPTAGRWGGGSERLATRELNASRIPIATIRSRDRTLGTGGGGGRDLGGACPGGGGAVEEMEQLLFAARC